MRRQVGNMLVPEELSELDDITTWRDFQPCVRALKSSLKKAQKAHMIKVRTYCELRSCAEHQETLLREMGWTHDDDDDDDKDNPDEGSHECVCSECDMVFNLGPHWPHTSNANMDIASPCVVLQLMVHVASADAFITLDHAC